MAKKEEEIKSLYEYFDYIKKYELLTPQWIFRGQNREFDNLLPGISRNAPGDSYKENEQNEKNYLDMFKRVLPLHNIRADLAPIDLLAIGQHYKLKTRLLDWSHSPFIALYFALDKLCLGSHAIVYACRFNEECYVYPENAGDIFSLKNIKVYTPDFIDNRIYNQRGAFTIHPFDKKSQTYRGINETTRELKDMIVFTVPYGYIHTLKLQIEQVGMSPLIIYSTLEASAEYANNWRLDYNV